MATTPATTTPEAAQTYGSLITALGETNEQKGVTENKQIEFVKIAIGDANDTYVQPDRAQTALVNERARFAVNAVDIIQANPGDVPTLRVQAFIPASVNGMVVREIAAVASYDGGAEYLHAVGNCARVYIPVPAKNAGVTNPASIEMFFVITSVQPIITVDASVAIATRNWVDDTFVKLLPPTPQEVDGLKTLFTTQLISQSTDKSQRFNLNIGNDGTLGGVYGLADGSNDKVWIRANPDGSTELYYNGVKRFETDEYGVINLGNENKLIYTTGGFCVHITGAGHGQLNQTDSKGVQEKVWAQFNRDGSTEFYYNDSKVVETNNDGVTIGSLSNKKLLITTDTTGAFFGFGSKPSIVAKENGATELYYNGEKVFATTVNGIQVFDATKYSQLWWQTGSGGISYDQGTGGKLALGWNDSGTDIYHNGAKVTGTNNVGITIGNSANKKLLITTDTTGAFFGFGSKPSIVARENGATEIYHNGVKTADTSLRGVSLYRSGGASYTALMLDNKSGNPGGDTSLWSEYGVANGQWGGLNSASSININQRRFTFHSDGKIGLNYGNEERVMVVSEGINISKSGTIFYQNVSSGMISLGMATIANSGIQFKPTGNALLGTWTGSVTPSDATLKNANPIGGLDKLNQLEPLEWTWSNPDHPAGEQGEPVAGQPETPAGGDSGDSVPDHRTHQGFTAQSYQKLFPHLVEEIQPEDIPAGIPNAGSPILGIKKDVTGHEMDALLVDSIQTLNKSIVDLNARVATMENGLRDDINLLQSLSDSVFSRISGLDAKVAKLEGTSTDGGST